MKIITNAIDFNKLVFRKYSMQKLTRNIDHFVRGLDTETLNGYCKLICDDAGNSKFTDNADDILQFFTHHRFRNSHNFFFNLNYDINALIKHLPLDNIKDLRGKLKTKYKNYSLFYIPKKIFRIIHANHSYPFYDVQQFFKSSLDKASQKYLGEKKYLEDIDPSILGSSATYWKENHDKIIRYCIHDAQLTQRLGLLLHSTLSKAVNLHPQRYLSKASISKELVRKTVTLPDIKEIDLKVLLYAFNSYYGGRFEIIRKGNVKYCSLIDINSAYPYHISNLVDVTKGTWKKTTSLHEEAHYGFYLVKVLTHYNTILPLPYKLPNKVICFPIIEMGCYLTKEELLAYEKYIDYEIISGYEFFTDTPNYLFRDYINILYSHKSKTPKDNYEYELYKIIMNALYGCFYEKYKRDDTYYVGKLFNPIYATLITSNTRIDLFLKALEYNKDVIGFATDSILIKGRIRKGFNKELGGWSSHGEGNTIVLKGGMYKVKDKIKNRGIKKVSKLHTPHGDYTNIFDYIHKMPELSAYPIITNRPLTFKEVLLKHKLYSPEDINIFTDMQYEININKDHKRIWEDTFMNGGELFTKEINSDPLIIEVA